jgi:hypothetical protein
MPRTAVDDLAQHCSPEKFEWTSCSGKSKGNTCTEFEIGTPLLCGEVVELVCGDAVLACRRRRTDPTPLLISGWSNFRLAGKGLKWGVLLIRSPAVAVARSD